MNFFKQPMPCEKHPCKECCIREQIKEKEKEIEELKKETRDKRHSLDDCIREVRRFMS